MGLLIAPIGLSSTAEDNAYALPVYPVYYKPSHNLDESTLIFLFVMRFHMFSEVIIVTLLFIASSTKA